VAEFDTAELLTDVRDRGSIPAADLRFPDASLLKAVNVELRDFIAPLLVETQSDRGVYLHEVTATSGTAEYRLPARALGFRFTSVGWKAPGQTRFQRLRHLNPDAYLEDSGAQGVPTGFFVRDNVLVLVPTPNAAGTLRVPYYARPNALVASSAAGVITSSTSTTVTVSSSPGAFLTGLEYEVVRGTPGFETVVARAVATKASNTFTFPTAFTGTVAAGDYLCLAGQAPVAQCPVEVRGLLAVRAARRALKAVNEGQQASMLNDDVAELEMAARSLLAPRADAEPQEWGDATRGVLFGVV
jgi:hypothetical protein